MKNINNIERLFASFNDINILIIGDVMLDAYIWGKVERVSPEAPVPIVTIEKRENRLGGAANVALNIKSLGANPVLCSVIGNDDNGNIFNKLLKNEGLSDKGIIKSKDRKTTTKFRIIGNNVQLLRIDDEITNNITKTENNILKNRIETLLNNGNINAILFQDYDKGVINKNLIEHVVMLAQKYNIPVAVDPKKSNFLHYKNVTLFKPNLKELKEGLNINLDLKDKNSIEKAVSILQEKLNADIVMNTLSEGGVYTRWKNGDKYFSYHNKAHLRNIADVSGAGDTVISVSALCLSAGLKPDKITEIANLAGGLVCEEVGVVPINKEKFKQEIQKFHILD